MKIEEISLGLRNKYEQDCVCGKSYLILSQDSNFPEYETRIYLLCDCREYVEFVLPVN